jgi:hypothetical protein
VWYIDTLKKYLDTLKMELEHTKKNLKVLIIKFLKAVFFAKTHQKWYYNTPKRYNLTPKRKTHREK